MKILVLFSFCSLALSGQSQLISGDLLQEGRKLVTESDFRLSGSSEGDIYFELAVDREGRVTSETLLKDKTTVVSTPTRIRAQQLVGEFKFEPGTHYPHFHHVVVKISVRKAGE